MPLKRAREPLCDEPLVSLLLVVGISYVFNSTINNEYSMVYEFWKNSFEFGFY
jgi:hypothetical protein